VSEPVLSAVIPVHNAARYVSAAIASVREQGVTAQIIVVDDGSTDETPAIVQAMADVAYIRQDRGGAGAARNRGVREATGRYLAFLDADDYWSPAKTVRQRRWLDDHGADMVFGHAEEFAGDPADASIAPPSPARAARLPGTLLIARETFARVGGFSDRWRVGEFIDWYLRAVDLGLTAGMVPDVVLRRRLHDANLGRTAGDSRVDYLRIIKDAMDRRQRRGQP
jgi:glycosyltransferase involved in cell wall biosynthesis